jgi:nucleoside-diphosphate-sugar epimerase
MNLVIGSEGFVGRSLCSYLEARGETVVHFDVVNGPHEDGRVVDLDLSNIRRIYFLAWDVGGAKYLYGREAQFSQLDWNLRLLLNIMPQIGGSKLPFLFISSQLAVEVDTVYGVTKRLGEVWTRLLNGTSVRLWNVYGGFEPSNKRSHVVADFVHQAISSGEINMLTDGSELRQFIYIDDVCRAFVRAVDLLEEGSLGPTDIAVDVSSFQWTSVRQVAECISEQTGCKLIPGSRPGSTPVTPMSGMLPGWRPEVSIEDGLARTIDLFRTLIDQAS